MAYRNDNKSIVLGSGKIFIMESTSDNFPTIASICQASNLLGYVKNGASLTYSQETVEEQDDLGFVIKVVTTKEEAVLKCGIITWNSETLMKLIDNARTDTTANGRRIINIGGKNIAQGKKYFICFKHEDAADGNIWIIIKGTNKAGLTLTFSPDSATVLEPEFRALPVGNNGVLIQYTEQVLDTGGDGNVLPNPAIEFPESDGLTALTVTCEEGSASGTTSVTYTGYEPSIDESLVYKLDTEAVEVEYDDELTEAGGWTRWNGEDDIDATADQVITLAVIVTSSEKARAAGHASVVVLASRD